MALRNQPYFPLYTQDFISDEKLRECSASSVGVYIFLMCVLHKSDQYGALQLKPKDKTSEDSVANFAVKLSKHLPFDTATIEAAIRELLDTGVLSVDGDTLFQKRMVKDGAISDIRSSAGRKGGNRSRGEDANSDFASAKGEAKGEQNSENEDEIENETGNSSSSGKESAGEEGQRDPPEPPVYSLLLIDGAEYGITKAQFEKWEKMYPAVDVMQELRKMDGWLDANPKKRKTKNGIMRFINGWLAREQDRGGSRDRKQRTEGGSQDGNAGQDRGNTGKGWKLQNDLSD